MPESVAGFTPDQLQLIGLIVVTFGGLFLTAVGWVAKKLWEVATWKATLENDVNNLGAIVGTKKGLALAEKRKQKRGE